MIQSETGRWKEVLTRLICIIQFLGSQSLAFRGQKDKLFERNNGNFLKLVEFVSKFDVVMADHVRRVTNNETHLHYLGKRIQNEIIDILATKIMNSILNDLSQASYYSIVVDCTPDVSHVEQMTLVIRFVKCHSGERAEIKEHFLGFISIDNTSGESLTNAILKKLQDLKIPLDKLRGQGYDNGSNMKGKHLGVQKRILDLNHVLFSCLAELTH